ncbi:MAG: trypsin-like peptidase domain-containing protein [Anaerolineae bacterium]|nr:trypsin-like peptidase domain-containing protein [Anaerolineae bacterium]
MAEVLQNLSNALADTVESASSGVVRVEARRRLPGTGIVWSSDGVIVTTHHVVERDDNIMVGLPDGKTVAATLVGRDPSTDVAVLRAQVSGLKAIEQANTDSLRVGHLVLALGRPGENVLSTLGIISAVGEGFRAPGGGVVDRYLQTDVAMYPGFSGGPLVDMEGHVIGINTSAMRGLSLTIPMPILRRVVGSLLAHGKVKQGFLGVGAQPVRLPAGLASQLNQETGLLVASVEPDSPADRGGILLGDTLVALDNTPLRHMDDLLGLLRSDRVGVATPIRLIRGGQVQELKITIGERP